MRLSKRDAAVVWHPYTQMQTAEDALPVVAAKGAWLQLEDGLEIFDAISSWWVTVHGHSHPYIAAAVAAQAQQLDQVIFAGFTHPQAVILAERLLEKLPDNQKRIFYSDDGSTAIEVALKMAFQYWRNKGEARNHIVALEDAYHGDTFGAMSVSARSSFTQAFEQQLFSVSHIPNPTTNATDELLTALAKAHAQQPLAALIVEPLVQGAGGMKMYAAEKLDQLVEWCRSEGVLVIFDEVMTGFYRTGKLFAAQHLQLSPDIFCLSKGLTGGFLPLSVTSCTAEIFDAFLSDDRSKMLFHGHSFTANPIGCAAANASLDLFETAETQNAVILLVEAQKAAIEMFEGISGIENVRSFGTILAMDLVGNSGYLADSGRKIAQKMLENRIFIRPLGNVIYLMPTYATTADEMKWVHQTLKEVLLANS